LTRRLCVYRSSLGEPVRRPLRRSAGHTRPPRAWRRRPHPGGGGRRRSTARWDCRSRVVPVRRRARLRRACGRDARAPGATLRCALLHGAVFGEPRRACAVRAPPARMRAGRPRTRRNPQVRAPLQGQAGWQAPTCHLPFQASGRPPSLFSLCGSRGSEDEGQTRTGMPQTAH
jgi:hypothetical protein